MFTFLKKNNSLTGQGTKLTGRFKVCFSRTSAWTPQAFSSVCGVISEEKPPQCNYLRIIPNFKSWTIILQNKKRKQRGKNKEKYTNQANTINKSMNEWKTVDKSTSASKNLQSTPSTLPVLKSLQKLG